MDTRTRIDKTQTGGPSPAVAWIRLARGASLAMVVWSVALQATLQALIPPVAVIGLAFLVFAVFLAGERRRLGLTLAVFGAVAYFGNLPIILADLGSPESAPTFILTLLSTVGAVLAVIGGLGAFFRWSPRPIEALTRGAISVFVAGTVISLAVAAGTTPDTPLPSDVAITASDLSFQPEAIVFASGSSGVWVENQDPVPHTLTVEELGIDVEIPAFTARRVDVDAPPGTYRVICSIPGHEAMAATLTIGG